jgi:hypothetical protein
MLANVLKRCNLTIVSSVPTSDMIISDDSISTTNWQEMGIFEKVTVLRALCDARLDRPDLEQVTEVSTTYVRTNSSCHVFVFRTMFIDHF